jgi:gluconolactonase
VPDIRSARPNAMLGIHCDSKGNVYVGCGDGVHVFNTSGKLLGKIYVGMTVANFQVRLNPLSTMLCQLMRVQFAGDGRMVLCAETHLFYATLGAKGADITNYDYTKTTVS